MFISFHHAILRFLGLSPSSPATVPPPSVKISEEPLSLSGDQGFGYFPGRAGLLLNNGRYEILRKLGRGQYSTTWLVSDSQCVYKSILSRHSL
jgi:hypothetical protein